MAFNLGFQTKHILNPLSMLFHPAKVPLKVFSILFKSHLACCVLFKVWILTGDKKETAINISRSCGHWRPNMQLIDIAGRENNDREPYFLLLFANLYLALKNEFVMVIIPLFCCFEPPTMVHINS